MDRQRKRDGYRIASDPGEQDVNRVQALLATSYWAERRPLDIVSRSLENSVVFGLFRGDEQVGVARVVTDFATFAWLCDVIVAKEHRGRGLGAWLIESALGHPELQGIRRWLLATKDAQALYERFGFAPVRTDLDWMERLLDEL